MLFIGIGFIFGFGYIVYIGIDFIIFVDFIVVSLIESLYNVDCLFSEVIINIGIYSEFQIYMDVNLNIVN